VSQLRKISAPQWPTETRFLSHGLGPLRRRLATWGMVLSVLFVLPFSATVSEGQTATHEHHHEMTAGMPMDMPMNIPVDDKAFSEFSHHLAGAFVLAMSMGELNMTLSMSVLTWTRFLLPFGMLVTGIFLLLWSDIDVWSFSNGFVHPVMIGIGKRSSTNCTPRFCCPSA